jgi:hypothetical protein
MRRQGIQPGLGTRDAGLPAASRALAALTLMGPHLYRPEIAAATTALTARRPA